MHADTTDALILVAFVLVATTAIYLWLYKPPRPLNATSIFASAAMVSMAVAALNPLTPQWVARGLILAAGSAYPAWGIILAALGGRHTRWDAPRLMLVGALVWGVYGGLRGEAFALGLAMGSGGGGLVTLAISYLEGRTGTPRR